MSESESSQLERALQGQSGRVGLEVVVPNPKLKLLDQVPEVLHQAFENVQAVRAKRPVRVPVVLTPEEVKRVIEAMSGSPQWVAKLLYGSGLRLTEALRLRVKDLDFEMKQLPMIYTHVLRQGGSGMKSPLDCL